MSKKSHFYQVEKAYWLFYGSGNFLLLITRKLLALLP